MSQTIHQAKYPLQAMRQKITKISQAPGGTVGIAVMHLETGDTFTLNNTHHFPMQSVFKFPLAFHIMHLVDEKKLSLTQKVHIDKKDLKPTYSPIKDKYPEGNIDLPLKELISYSVSLSDNNACDILFRLAGGTAKTNAYIQKIAGKQIAIAANEEEMSKAWEVQYTNWCTPYTMLTLLQTLHEGKQLSAASHEFLLRTMEETSTGPKRLKGKLPEGTVVAHKTGTSNTNDKGITAATNDVGIITLPNGQHLAIVVLVSDSPASQDIREGTIANIAEIFWDHYAYGSR